MQQEGMDKKTTSMKSVNFAGLENPQQLTLAKLEVVAANCGLDVWESRAPSWDSERLGRIT